MRSNNYIFCKRENSFFHKVVCNSIKEILQFKDYFLRYIFLLVFFSSGRWLLSLNNRDFARIKSVSDGFSRELFITTLIADGQ